MSFESDLDNASETDLCNKKFSVLSFACEKIGFS